MTFFDGAQRLDGFGQGELLSDKTRDEAAAADFSLHFQPPIHDQQVTPGQYKHFTSQENAKHDSVATKLLTSDAFAHADG